MFKKKPTASEVDGVQYRRAKTWQIICYACNALVGMSVYSLIGMASYSARLRHYHRRGWHHPDLHPYSGRHHRPAAGLCV